MCFLDRFLLKYEPILNHYQKTLQLSDYQAVQAKVKKVDTLKLKCEFHVPKNLEFSETGKLTFNYIF